MTTTTTTGTWTGTRPAGGSDGRLPEGHPLSLRTAGEVMTPHVVAVAGSATLGQAMALLRHWAVRHLPVTEEDRFVGMVDDRLVASALLTADGWETAVDLPVSAVMMRYVPQVGPEAPMPRVATLLRSSRCDAVVVVDERDRLLGLITMVDVVTAVAHSADAPAG